MTADDDLLRTLRDDLDAFDSDAARPLDDPYVVCWRDLDAKTTRHELDRLNGWVTWLVKRYCIDHKTIPPCWARHGALTEELSALRTLWEVCYTGDAAPADPATFHRELDAAQRRLREWSARRGCTRTEHRNEHPPQA
jgi:hypothetical protein